MKDTCLFAHSFAKPKGRLGKEVVVRKPQAVPQWVFLHCFLPHIWAPIQGKHAWPKPTWWKDGRRSSWGKVIRKGKAGCVKPQRIMYECGRCNTCLWASLHVFVCVLCRGRWGHRSQPADASRAGEAGSRGGRSQTLIRGSSSCCLSCFHLATRRSHRHRVSDLTLSAWPLHHHPPLRQSPAINCFWGTPHLRGNSRVRETEMQRHNGKESTGPGTPLLTHFIPGWADLSCAVFIGAFLPHYPKWLFTERNAKTCSFVSWNIF